MTKPNGSPNKIHICLVSEQAAANLLPALDPALKPEKIVLVVTARMQNQAADLAAVFRENAIEVEQLQLSNEQEFTQTQNELFEMATRLEKDAVALNLTGGTKLMSLAAQSIARVSEWRMFYVDADSDRVIWLGDDKEPPHPLKEQLRLRHYLRSYGFNLDEKPERPNASAKLQQLMHTLVLNVGSLARPLASLNWLAQQAEEENSLKVSMDVQRDRLDDLLRKFQEAEVLAVEGADIRFPDSAARDFVKGGWLELHTIHALNQITGPLRIRDKALGLQVTDVRTQVRNELDVAFVARNRLFVIECKTARIDRPQGGTEHPTRPKANDTLFKLAENCRRIGGVGTRGMLVTYHDLRDPERKLAKALRIEVIAGVAIARLPEKLKHWVQPQH